MNSAQNDANSNLDAPDVVTGALQVNLDTAYNGTIGDTLLNIDSASDNYDYYKFDYGTTGYLKISIQIYSVENSSLTSFYVRKDGWTVASELLWNDDLPFDLIVPLIDLTPLIFRVSSYSDYAEYGFTISVSPGSYSQDDASLGRDVSRNLPGSISLDVTYNGRMGNGEIDALGLRDNTDFYQVNLPDQGYLLTTINLLTDDDYFDLFVSIETPAGDDILYESASMFSGFLQFQTPIAGSGSYGVYLFSFGWNVSYDLTLTFTSAILPTQNDAGFGSDAAKDFAAAPIVALNSTFLGTLGQGLLDASNNAMDDKDFYKLGPLNYGQLNVSVSFISSIDTFPSVYFDLNNNSDPFPWSYLDLRASSFTPTENGVIILSSSDQYYLELWTFDYNVTYEISLQFIELNGTVISPPPTNTTTVTVTGTVTNTQTDTVTDTVTNTQTGTVTNTQTETVTNPGSTETSIQTETIFETVTDTNFQTDTTSITETVTDTSSTPISFLWLWGIVSLLIIRRSIKRN